MLKRTPLKRGKSTIKSSSSLKRGVGLKSSSTLKRGNTPIKKVNKTDERLVADQLKRDKRTAFFEECWEKLPKVSEVSGYKFRTFSRAHYHHTFPKSKYPEIEFCMDVILRVSFDEHQIVEGDLEIFEEAKAKRNWVKENWEKCIECSKLWEQNYEKYGKR